MSNLTTSRVFFTNKINAESLIQIYDELCIDVYTNKNMAVKISTGELGGHNFLDPKFIKPLIKKINGTIVECNTAYKGKKKYIRRPLGNNVKTWLFRSITM